MDENILRIFGWLLIFGVVCILIRIISDLIQSKFAEHPYKLKSSLLTPNELDIYKIIKQVLPQGLILIPQVHYIEILDVKNGNRKKYAARNKIDRKSIDYVIFNEDNFAPLLAIELDDRTHERDDRIEKDKFENIVFNDVGLKFLRIRYSDTNNIDDFRLIIQSELAK